MAERQRGPDVIARSICRKAQSLCRSSGARRFDPSIRYRARKDASASIKARAATRSAAWKPSVNRSWIGWRNANASVKRPWISKQPREAVAARSPREERTLPARRIESRPEIDSSAAASASGAHCNRTESPRSRSNSAIVQVPLCVWSGQSPRRSCKSLGDPACIAQGRSKAAQEHIVAHGCARFR